MGSSELSVYHRIFPFVHLQPERIDPSASRQGYDVRSDVWSLGITLVRLKGFIKLSCCDKDKSTVLDNHSSFCLLSV